VTGPEGMSRDRPQARGAFDELLDRLSVRLDPVDVPMRSCGSTIHAAVALLLRPAAGAAGGTGRGSVEILFIRARSARASRGLVAAAA
jgi:hypothetical protein